MPIFTIERSMMERRSSIIVCHINMPANGELVFDIFDVACCTRMRMQRHNITLRFHVIPTHAVAQTLTKRSGLMHQRCCGVDVKHVDFVSWFTSRSRWIHCRGRRGVGGRLNG